MQKGTKLIEERVVAICEEEWFRGVGMEDFYIGYQSTDVELKGFLPRLSVN